MASLAAPLAQAASAVAGEEIEIKLERPSDAEHGDYATSVALQLAKKLGRPPREVADELATSLASAPSLATAPEIAGPGFLNLRVSDDWYRQALTEILEAGDAYGGGSATTRERIQVELVSANPTGPLTVGSARNGAYGDAVARLLELSLIHI